MKKLFGLMFFLMVVAFCFGQTDSLLIEASKTLDSLITEAKTVVDGVKEAPPKTPFQWVTFLIITLGGLGNVFLVRIIRLTKVVKTIIGDMSTTPLVLVSSYIIAIVWSLVQGGWAVFSMSDATVLALQIMPVSMLIYESFLKKLLGKTPK